jgi:ribosome-binding protein aMBF1 (putative translation factor)
MMELNGRSNGKPPVIDDPESVPSDEEIEQLLADAEDPSQWNEEEIELGPGFYRAPEVAQQLARTLAEHRAAHGLTQQQLGRTLYLHQSQIARLESGQHTPELETLVRIARHLGLTFTVQVAPTGASLSAANMPASA